MLCTLNSAGYRYGASDLAFYIPAALERIDPSLFPRDTPLIASQAKLTMIDETIAGLSRVTGLGLPPLFATLYADDARASAGRRHVARASAVSLRVDDDGAGSSVDVAPRDREIGNEYTRGLLSPSAARVQFGCARAGGADAPPRVCRRHARLGRWASPPDDRALVFDLDRRRVGGQRSTLAHPDHRRGGDRGDRGNMDVDCGSTGWTAGPNGRGVDRDAGNQGLSIPA